MADNDLERRAKHCTTHHHACDCREWRHRREVNLLKERLAAWRELSFMVRYLEHHKHHAATENKQNIEKLRELGEVE